MDVKNIGAMKGNNEGVAGTPREPVRGLRDRQAGPLDPPWSWLRRAVRMPRR